LYKLLLAIHQYFTFIRRTWTKRRGKQP